MHSQHGVQACSRPPITFVPGAGSCVVRTHVSRGVCACARADYLDEAKGWAISEEELHKQYDAAAARGVKTRALVVINPGSSREDRSAVDVVRCCWDATGSC